MLTARRTTRAFTLVELLVVIGIIAALIAILLPVLSGVQSRARDLKCKSNLRSICQALIGYASENKGSMPYAFYWNRGDPVSFSEAPDNAGSSGDPQNTHPFISWPSVVGKYMGKRLAGDNDDTNFPPVLRCPEAQQLASHPVSYVMNLVVAVHPAQDVGVELRYGSRPNAQTAPAKVNRLTKDTALVWDTPVKASWGENIIGFLIGFDIDDERFITPDRPSQRFLFANDPYGQFDPPIPGGVGYGNNKKIKLNVGSNGYKNIDGGDIIRWPYQGNLRFRHNKDTQCNVAFSDGHVDAFTCKMQRDKSVRPQDHDALRRNFMPKPPQGLDPGTDPILQQ